MSDFSHNWTEWTFSPSIQEEVSEFCAFLARNTEPRSQLSQDWLKLRDYSSRKQTPTPDTADVSMTNISSQEERNITSLLLEALEGNGTLDQALIQKVPTHFLEQIFSDFQAQINKENLPQFCKIIEDWNDNSIIDACFSCVLLPKFEECESTVCTSSSVKNLALKMPDKVCNNLLLPLLMSDKAEFSDSELLENVFPILPDTSKDILIMAIIKRKEFKESYWLLLQPLITHMTLSSMNQIVLIMNSLSQQFASSQIFSKFLVAVCKNLQPGMDKTLLHQVVDKNQTLLKRQALKHLSS